ncbi:hypothetical protein PMAYCL1PPCAC_17169, partial [Pristionchus mayeri]
TVFCYKYTSPCRLYVKFHGNEIDAEVPCNITSIEAHKDAIYFASDDQVFKADFFPTVGITVSQVGNIREGEEIHGWGLCSRVRKGKRSVYRLWDDPETDGIIIEGLEEEDLDVSEDEEGGLLLVGLHRGRAICLSKCPRQAHPSVRNLEANAIVVEASWRAYPSVYARETSPFIYISLFNEDLHTLDTRTMTFLPTLKFEGVDRIWKLVDIHKEEITALAKIGDDIYSVNVHLPIGYYGNSTTNGEHEVVQKMKESIKEFCDALTKCSEREKEGLEKIKELKAENEQLKAKIAQMEEDLEVVHFS